MGLEHFSVVHNQFLGANTLFDSSAYGHVLMCSNESERYPEIVGQEIKFVVIYVDL
jgi:hypothetical protein